MDKHTEEQKSKLRQTMEVCDVVMSAKGKEKLVARGYLFCLRTKHQRKSTGEVAYHWRCDGFGSEDRKCKGSAVTVIVDGKHRLQKFSDHPTHKPEAGRAEVYRVKEEIKMKAANCEQTPAEIVEDVLSKIDPSLAPYIPKRETLKQTIRRKRMGEGVYIPRVAAKRPKSMADRDVGFVNATVTPCELMKAKLVEEEKPTNFMEDEEDSESSITDNSLDTLQFENRTNDKIEQLISYLDELDKVDHSTITALECGMPLDNSQDLEKMLSIPKFQYLAKKDQPALVQEIVTLKLIIEEKQNEVATLKSALCEQRDVGHRNMKTIEKHLKKQMQTEKSEHNTTISRHQKNIDQLIGEKKIISEKCEKLSSDLETLEKKHADNLKVLEEHQSTEPERTKDMNRASEKIQHDEWASKLTKEIKETTVKELEMKMENIMSKYTEKVIVAVKSSHQDELQLLEEQISSRYTNHLEDLCREMTVENRMHILEWNAMQQRSENTLEHEKTVSTEQTTRREVSSGEERKHAQQIQKNFDDRLMEATAKLREIIVKTRQADEKRHQLELHTLKENMNAEKELWIKNQTKVFGLQMAKREAELREACRHDLDREIQFAVEKLDAEADFSRTESEYSSGC